MNTLILMKNVHILKDTVRENMLRKIQSVMYANISPSAWLKENMLIAQT